MALPYPVSAVKIPAGLGGQTNGKITSPPLVAAGIPGRPNAKALSLAARALEAFAAEVDERFNRVLTVTSTADAYRSYAIQEATFRLRYTTTVLPGRPSKMWNGVRWYQKPGTAMAAVPGTSNHGWGLAFDVCYWDDRDQDAVIDPGDEVLGVVADMPCFNWMLGNAFRYGLSWEAQSEPWHIRYHAGDDVPQAVEDYFNPPQPQPPLPPIGAVMDSYLLHNGAVFGHDSKLNVKQHVPDPAAWNLQRGLRALDGQPPLPEHQADRNLMRATGPVIGPVPQGFDDWGAQS